MGLENQIMREVGRLPTIVENKGNELPVINIQDSFCEEQNMSIKMWILLDGEGIFLGGCS